MSLCSASKCRLRSVPATARARVIALSNSVPGSDSNIEVAPKPSNKHWFDAEKQKALGAAARNATEKLAHFVDENKLKEKSSAAAHALEAALKEQAVKTVKAVADYAEENKLKEQAIQAANTMADKAKEEAQHLAEKAVSAAKTAGVKTVEAADKMVKDVAKDLDTDGDGKVSAEELKAGMENSSSKMLAAVAPGLDLDGDGKVSQEELQMAAKEQVDAVSRKLMPSWLRGFLDFVATPFGKLGMLVMACLSIWQALQSMIAFCAIATATAVVLMYLNSFSGGKGSKKKTKTSKAA